MMERFLMEYLTNSIWQIPLIAAGAWLILRTLRPSPSIQHRIWLATLALMLTMPLLTHRAIPSPTVPSLPPAAAPLTQDVPDNTPATTLDFQPMDQPAVPGPVLQLPPQPSDETAATSWHPLHELVLTPLATHWLIGLYLGVIAFMAMRLLSSAWASHRLIAQANLALLSDAASDQFDLCCKVFDVARPKIMVSAHTSSPMVVGTIRPVLLLPQSFAARLEQPATQPTHETEAVWLHELAHLSRRDHLTNLLCRIAALPIAYHPAAHAVQQRIRRTREMVCDEMAATAMQSRLSYARCLVGLARTMQTMTPQIEAIGMFNDGVLEERIMQLTKTKTLISARNRTLRIACGAAMTFAVLAIPAIFHVTPTLAQASAPTPSNAAPTSTPSPTPTPAPPPQAQPQPPASASRKNVAKTNAADAQPRAIAPDDNKQLEDARKRLDHAARAYGDLAAKSADSSGQSTETSTPEFRQQMDEARRQLREATRAWNEQITTVDSALRERQFTVDNTELNKRMAELQARLNSPEFKEKMAKMNQQMAEAQAKFNSPEFKKQMADLQAKFNSPEWKEKTQKLSEESARMQAKFSSPDWKAQMDKLNSPEFRKQLQENSEMTRQMNILSDDLSRQMDKVSKQIDEALRLWRANAPTQ